MFGVKIKAVYLSTLHSVTDNDSHGNVVKYHALTSLLGLQHSVEIFKLIRQLQLSLCTNKTYPKPLQRGLFQCSSKGRVQGIIFGRT